MLLFSYFQIGGGDPTQYCMVLLQSVSFRSHCGLRGHLEWRHVNSHTAMACLCQLERCIMWSFSSHSFYIRTALSTVCWGWLQLAPTGMALWMSGRQTQAQHLASHTQLYLDLVQGFLKAPQPLFMGKVGSTGLPRMNACCKPDRNCTVKWLSLEPVLILAF